MSRRPAEPHSAPRPAGRASTLQVYGQLADVEPEWKAFEEQADCTVFQAYDWLAKWQQHIGSRNGTMPAIVLGRDAHGAVVFILQLAIETGRFTRRLTWLGSELCDYNAPLLAPDFSHRLQDGQFALLWREIVALLQSDRRFRFDLIDLQKMPETIGAQRNPFLDLPVLAHPSGAYIATLGNDWEAFYAAKRSASTRKRERRQLKHLAEHGEVRFVDVEDRDDIVRTLETLLSQKSRSFARMGVRNIFARPGYREFLLDIATDLNVRALTHISRLDVGDNSRGRQSRAAVPQLLLPGAVELSRRRDRALRPRPRASARAPAPCDRQRLRTVRFHRRRRAVQARLVGHRDAVVRLPRRRDRARLAGDGPDAGVPPHQALHQADARPVEPVQQGALVRGLAPHPLSP